MTGRKTDAEIKQEIVDCKTMMYMHADETYLDYSIRQIKLQASVKALEWVLDKE